MKEMYITPTFEVVAFEVEDVITASGFDLASKDNELKDKWVKNS